MIDSTISRNINSLHWPVEYLILVCSTNCRYFRASECL